MSELRILASAESGLITLAIGNGQMAVGWLQARLPTMQGWYDSVVKPGRENTDAGTVQADMPSGAGRVTSLVNSTVTGV